jgi:heme/copper-type cytochrome/quinol oxidase subunit 1
VTYWFPKFTGRMMSERVGRNSFWIAFPAFHLTFFPMHLLGIMGMPRRVYTYPAGLGWDGLNLISSIGAFIFAAGVLVFVGNMIWAMRRVLRPVPIRGARRGSNGRPLRRRRPTTSRISRS